jgi:ubiquinone/menaquinone biosynthesis C-methylase UbiE
MIVEYEKNAQAAHLSEKIIGRAGDLLTPVVEEKVSDLPDFDIVAVSMALHHFENPPLGVQQLARWVKAGGIFVVIDLVVQDHGPHGFGGAKGTISTHGFSREQMQKIFEEAGLSNFDYKVVPKPLRFVHDGKAIEKTVFIARAQRV